MRVDIVYHDGLPIELEHHRLHVLAEYTPARGNVHLGRVRGGTGFGAFFGANFNVEAGKARAGAVARSGRPRATLAKPSEPEVTGRGRRGAGSSGRNEKAFSCAK